MARPRPQTSGHFSVQRHLVRRFRNSTCQKLLKAPFVQAVSSATNNIHLSVVNGSLSLRQASKLWPSRICVRLVLTLETLLRPREIAARWRRPAAIDFIDLMFYSWRSLQAFRESLVPDPLEWERKGGRHKWPDFLTFCRVFTLFRFAKSRWFYAAKFEAVFHLLERSDIWWGLAPSPPPPPLITRSLFVDFVDSLSGVGYGGWFRR